MASTSSSQLTLKLGYGVSLSFRSEVTRKSFVDHIYDELKEKGIHTFKDDERLEKGQCIAPTLLQDDIQESTRKFTYDVFLSFRGEDTRKSFVDHLYDRLKQKGIHTFKDDERLEKGQCIAPTLVQAIQESRFAIVVFSKDYASSTWCLDEVAKIMECKEKLDQVVVPIFYDVEPSDVRKQTGSFGESFAKHEENFKDDEGKAKVERWRKALTAAGNIAGHHLHGVQYNGYELVCIKGAVDAIFKQLRPAPSIPKNLVDLESPLKDISILMEVPSKDVKLIGIWGMGGIGKTTIARAAFAKFSSQFDGACFLEDIRENNSRQPGMKCLQEKLLTILLKEKVRINDEHNGTEMIEERLKWMRVLIVLDDVDQQDQLDKLVGDGKWLCNGSRLIVTTRDKHLLTQFGVVVECYEVKKLNEENALKLFSWHAFKKESPENGFEHLSTSFVSHASGLPLALKVWGSFLCGRTDKKVWESTLEKIKDIPDEEVIKKLRISYDGLDENCKEVFLVIARFFREKERDFVEDVLKGCKLHPVANITVLIDRCLLFIDHCGYINMHDLIHEMGLNIERENRRKRWQLHNLDGLRYIMEPEAVEGLWLLFNSYDENISPCIEAFKGMTNLKMLIVRGFYYSEFLESYGMRIMDNLPRSLMVLIFKDCPCSKLFCTKDLKNLTFLDLSYSKSLLETPNFAEMPNLEKLYLKTCIKLKEIHPAVGNLMKLVLLDLRKCKNLEKLPSFNQVSSLKSLNLDICQKLKKFPEIKARLPYLVDLVLLEVGIIELPSSIQLLHGLTKLHVSRCVNMVRLSNGLCELKNLKVLKIAWCWKIKSLPENLERLISLEYLNLTGSGFVDLPESFSQLSRLQYLDITSCGELKKLPELPANIKELYAESSFAFGSNIAKLANECSKLYSVSFCGDQFEQAKEFIHFPFCSKNPFCVSYESCTKFTTVMETYILESFKYQCYESNGISINLNPPWYSQNFVGFVVYFCSLKGDMWGPHSYKDIVGYDIKHTVVIAKLSPKDNENEVLQTECVIVKKCLYPFPQICFGIAYIPFSSLWPESKTKMDGVTPDEYSRFEVKLQSSTASTNWGCNLFMKGGKNKLGIWDGSLGVQLYMETIQDLLDPSNANISIAELLKLASLYQLVDSIVKNIGREYIRHFNSLPVCLRCCKIASYCSCIKFSKISERASPSHSRNDEHRNVLHDDGWKTVLHIVSKKEL